MKASDLLFGGITAFVVAMKRASEGIVWQAHLKDRDFVDVLPENDRL